MAVVAVAHFVGKFCSSRTRCRGEHRFEDSKITPHIYWIIVGCLLVNLEPEEVESLIVEINVAETLHMSDDFDYTSQSHFNLN